MDSLIGIFSVLGIGEYTALHFDYFIEKQSFYVILGILTMSLAILARNKLAIVLQILLGLAFWFHSWSEVLLRAFVGDLDLGNLQIWYNILLIIFATIQIISFILLIIELINTINKETPKK